MLNPFTDAQKEIIESADKISRAVSSDIRARYQQALLSGEPAVLEPEDQALVELLTGFGLLFNAAVQAGWINGVVLTVNGDNNGSSD